MKTLIRKIVSRIPGVRFWVARAVFLGPTRNSHRFWGIFPSYAAAKAHVPRKFDRGFGAPNLGDFEDDIPERDQDAIRVLSGLFPNVKNLFDLGGNVGMCFYQYRIKLPYPHDFHWTVCDTPIVNDKGRALAEKRMETQLLFTDDRSVAESADVFLTNGALQYLEDSLVDILARLKNKPPHVIINRVPLSENPSFFTLQNLGYTVVPYQIGNLKKFTAEIAALGYRLDGQWYNDRPCDLLLRPDLRIPRYYGFHFVKAGG